MLRLKLGLPCGIYKRRRQTILTIAAVAIAVFIIIFIQTLVTGVQERILKDLLGTLPHVTVEPPDP
jgi:ABC-type lipoprotein release transport system permease subunit